MIKPAIVPTRTRDQLMAALELANRIRQHRAHLKRAARTDPELVVRALSDPHPWVETMKVTELLDAIPGVGWMRIRTWLDRSGISYAKTLGGLTQRQRDALTQHVHHHLERRAA